MQIKYNYKEFLYKKALEEKKELFSLDDVIDFIESVRERGYVSTTNTAKKILEFLKKEKVYPLKYREIGRSLECDMVHPQNVKHSLRKLQKEGLIKIDEEKKQITLLEEFTN